MSNIERYKNAFEIKGKCTLNKYFMKREIKVRKLPRDRKYTN